MIYAGAEQIASMMVGNMGIKTAAIGADTIYTRPGGYLYIELNTKETDNG